MEEKINEIKVVAQESPELKLWLNEFAKANEGEPSSLTEGDIERMTVARIKNDRFGNI